MTGSGKSTLARSVIAKSSRTIIVDPNSEYHDALVVESVDDFLDYFIEEQPETFRVAIRIHNRFSVPESDMDAVFQSVWEIGNVLFVVEEVDAYIPPLERQNAFMPLISRGRHRKIHILGLAPRVPQFSRALRAQQTSFVSFAVSDPDDRENLTRYGFTDEELSKLTLENHEYLCHGLPVEEIKF